MEPSTMRGRVVVTSPRGTSMFSGWWSLIWVVLVWLVVFWFGWLLEKGGWRFDEGW